MTNTENLTSRVVKGSSWLFLFQIFDNILGVIRLIVLARLLNPQDFGLIGIATLVLQIIITFTQTGIQAMLIHKKDPEKYLDTAWTYLLIRGIVLYAIIFFTAPILGAFFNSTIAPDIIKWMGLSLVIEGFINIGIILFQKNLTFGKQFLYQMAGNLLDFVVAITAAFIYNNYWAFVAGYLANSIIRLLLSYFLSDCRPSFKLDFKQIREMNSYGKWIFGSSILTFLYSQADDILVGKLMGTVSLGYYQLAYRISNLPATQISYIISTVMFPAYSLMQGNKEKIASAYKSTLQVTAYLSFFMGSLIIALSHDFITLFLGRKWLPMETALQILTLWGLMRSIGTTTGALWQALGKPEIITKIQLFQTIVMFALIFPLTIWYGFVGTALSVVIAAFFSNCIAIFMISKSSNVPLHVLLMELYYPFICGVIVCDVYLLIRPYFSPDTSFTQFVALSFIAVFVYVISTFLMSKLFQYGVYKDIFDLIETIPALKRYNAAINKFRKLIS